ARLDPASPDEALDRVSAYYKDEHHVLEDSATRQVVAEGLWKGISFRNLSVEALAYIYENTLVDDETRRRYGTHSTPHSIARYIIHHLGLETLNPDDRRIVEPCSGHGIFLVAAL